MEMEFFVPPGRGAEVVRVLAATSASAGTSSSASAPTTCGCARTTPTSCRTTRRGTSDVEYLFPIGWRELEGIANRGDFDLTPARRVLGREARVLRPRRPSERYVPHVIEPAAGADRATLAFLVDAYDEEEVEGETRTRAAPAPAARAGQGRGAAARAARTASPRSRARSTPTLRRRMQAEYDEGGSIGKRYRRQDEIGTPWCVTIDHQTLEDRTVTLRDRDTLEQVRVPIDELGDELERRLRAPWTLAEARRRRRRGLAPDAAPRTGSRPARPRPACRSARPGRPFR